MKNDNATTCLSQFVRLLNVSVTSDSIHQELEKHPDHPSLLAFSDVLNNWQISNGSFQIDAEELISMPLPCIVHLSTNGGEFAVVNSVDKEHISILNETEHQFKFAIEEFSKFYTGFVLIAEPTPETGEQNYHQKRRKEIVENLRFPFVIAGFVTIAIILFLRSCSFGMFNWQVALLMFAKSAGLITTLLLLRLVATVRGNDIWG